jgi:hypothetical protein
MAKRTRNITTSQIQTSDSYDVSVLKPFRLKGCIKVVTSGKGRFWSKDSRSRLPREFQLCSVGASGKPGALQIMTPSKGRGYNAETRELIVGTTQKSCRLKAPVVHYSDDLDADAVSSIQELHGARRRRRRRKRR